MSEGAISTGDLIAVNFNNAHYTLTSKAQVLYPPCSDGDSWIIKDVLTGTIYHVSERCTITLIEKL